MAESRTSSGGDLHVGGCVDVPCRRFGHHAGCGHSSVAVAVLPAKGTELNLETINAADASFGEPLPVAGNVTADVNL